MIDVRSHEAYGHYAIDRVTFSVPKGEVLAFLVPTGRGRPDAYSDRFMRDGGPAKVAGYDCSTTYEVKRIGYCRKRPRLHELAVTEYIESPGAPGLAISRWGEP